MEPASGVRYRICDDIEERGRCTSDIAVTTSVGFPSSVGSSSSEVAHCWRRLGAEPGTGGSDVVEPLELLELGLAKPMVRSALSRLRRTRRVLPVARLDRPPYDSSS